MLTRLTQIAVVLLLLFTVTPTLEAQSSCVSNAESNGVPASIAEVGCAFEASVNFLLETGGDALEWLFALLWDELPDYPNMSSLGLTDCSACYMADMPD